MLGLSNEMLYIFVDQGVAKVQEVNFEVEKGILQFGYKATFYFNHTLTYMRLCTQGKPWICIF